MEGYSDCWGSKNYLGIQDAARKRYPPELTPGPWTGLVVHTDDGVRVLLTQVKWDRFKAIIARVSDKLEEEYPEGLDRKQLEHDRGFAIHAMGAYPTLRPYLKGTHQILEI